MSKKTAKQTKNGHKYIEVSIKEMIFSLFSIGICDTCCKRMSEGYLIPVLNTIYCKECFEEWQERAEYHEEDKFYEDMKTEHFLEVLNAVE